MFVVVLVFAVYLAAPGFLKTVENKLYDLHFTLRGVRPPGDQVTIIAIDDPSLAAVGRWPWPRSILAQMIERNCAQARRFAEGLKAAGFEILNDVVLNQVVVKFGGPERTKRIIDAIQADGTCWAGITVWQGHTAMRISVSSWATTDLDVERSLEAMLRCARETR